MMRSLNNQNNLQEQYQQACLIWKVNNKHEKVIQLDPPA